MRKIIMFSLVLGLLLPVKVSAATIPSSTCVNMFVDEKYSTSPYQTSNNTVYNQTKNCENVSGADHYHGEVDMLVEKYYTGDNLFKVNNYYLSPGESHKTTSTHASNGVSYVSSSSWETVNGGDGGRIKIYSSVE